MQKYVIEMLWDCTCGHKGNGGLSKHCVNCGRPKDPGCEDYFPSDISETNALRGEAKRKAEAGPDWQCMYCQSLQSSLNKCCSECGCDKVSGRRQWTAKISTIVEGFETVSKTKQIDEPSVSTESYEVPASTREPPVGRWKEVGNPFRRNTAAWKRVALTTTVLVLVGIVVWLVFRTKIVEASVTDTSWEYRVHIDRYQVLGRDGWNPDNNAFDVKNEGSRLHHHDKVVSGSHQEPYVESYPCGQTCVSIPLSCTSNGNGTATCTGGGQSCTPKTCTRTAYKTVTDYRYEPRYRDWYSWKVWDWEFNRTVKHSGRDTSPTWPESQELVVMLGQGEKERQRREEVYQVVFSDLNNEKHVYDPKSFQEFKTFRVGRKAKLKVGLAHGVEILSDERQ